MRAQVLNLSIETDKSTHTTLIDSLNVKTSYENYLSLKQAAKGITEKLQELGFIESELIAIKKKNDSSFIAKYFFGKKYKYIKVFYDPSLFSKKELAQISSEISENYFVLPFDTFEASLQKLNGLKTNNGKSFAKIKIAGLFPEENFLSGTIILENGATRTVDSIVIKGYEKFPKSFITHHAGLKKGTLFDEKGIKAKNEILKSLPFTTSPKVPAALFRKDSTIVYLYLKKRLSNLFDGVLGFATNERTNNLQINGYLNLELTNNLNYGEQLVINYKADGEEQRKLRVKTTLPYLFGTPLGAALELKIFKRDSTFITTDQQFRINYQVTPSYSSYIGYKGYESSTLLEEVTATNPIEDFKSQFLLAGFNFYTPQSNPLFPRKSEIFINTEIGSRAASDLTDNQIKILTRVNHIFNLNQENSIFIQNTSNILLSDTFIPNELFRFGGITSMRGFNEDSIDASLFSVFNTEYRYQFNQDVFIHSILDFAYFENKPLFIKEKLYGYGLGMGLQTKAGLLRFNIANGTSEDRFFNLSNTKIHLILSSRF